MRKTLRLKAVTCVLCIWKQGLLFRSLYSRPKYMQTDCWGLQVSHHNMLRAVSESFVLLAPWGWNENKPIAFVCFCKSKQKDSAPGKVNDVYGMSMQWEILELYEIRAVNKCLQETARPKSTGCCSTSCSLLTYTYKLCIGETFTIQEQLNSLDIKLWTYSFFQGLQFNKSKYENQAYN